MEKMQLFSKIMTVEEIHQLTVHFVSNLDIGPRSRIVYRRILQQFLEWLSALQIKAPQKSDILRFKQELIERDLSNLTINNYMTVIKLLFKQLAEQNVYPNVADGIKSSSRDRGYYKDALTLEQVKDLFAVFKLERFIDLRDFAIANLIIRTGLRLIEVSRANIGDLSQTGDHYTLHIQGKGKDAKNDFVILTHKTYKPIGKYSGLLKHNKPTDPLFQSLSRNRFAHRLTTRSLSRIIKGRFNQADIISKRITAHSLRHTAITLALKGGATVQEAQQMARHADINTTLIYAHNLDRIENAAEHNIDGILESITTHVEEKEKTDEQIQSNNPTQDDEPEGRNQGASESGSQSPGPAQGIPVPD